MNWRYLKLLLVLFSAGTFGDEAQDSNIQLKPFVSDGCSGFPNGTKEEPDKWLHCCVAHDLDYWRGGTWAERQASDERLKQCVGETDEEGISLIMLAGVRIGGTAFAPTSFRWGYGWPYGRGYKPLTREEETQIRLMMPVDIILPGKF